MILARSESAERPGVRSGVKNGAGDDLLEEIHVDRSRTGEGEKMSARAKQTDAVQIDVLVRTRSPRHVMVVRGELGRVQDDEVEGRAVDALEGLEPRGGRLGRPAVLHGKEVADVLGCVVTADAMSFQKVIIDKIRDKGADFVIELKANQSSLRYGLEDSIKTATPTDIYKESPCLEHGRIESRVCCIYCGEELIADREEWNGNLTVIEILTSTEKKSDGRSTSEQRLYISSLDSSAGRLSQITKQYWAIESMHWDLDRNLRQDSIKRKAERSARNPDTIQRMVLALIAVWKNRRKKISDKRKGTAEIIRELSVNFTNVLHFLNQK